MLVDGWSFGTSEPICILTYKAKVFSFFFCLTLCDPVFFHTHVGKQRAVIIKVCSVLHWDCSADFYTPGCVSQCMINEPSVK